MRMRRGWHTYWKNPGDSGLPPKIAWNLPEGFSAGPIEWPAPEGIATDALMSYGYTEEVLLPVEIVPPQHLAVDSVTLGGRFDWLECADVCLPASAVVSLSLPVHPEAPAPGPDAPAFAAARFRIPGAPTGWAFAAEAGPRAISLRFRDPTGIRPGGAYLFVDRPLVADYAAPQGFERVADGFRVTALPAANAQEPLERLTGVLVLEGGPGSRPRMAIQLDVPVTRGNPAPAPAQPVRTGPPIPWHTIAAALAGLGVAILLVRSMRAGWKNSRSRGEPSG